MTDKRFEQPERSENPVDSGPKNETHPAAADSSSANQQPTVIPAGGVLPTHAPAPGELLTRAPSEPQAAAAPVPSAAAASTSHPSHFGRYRVEKRLGRGGFGEVYRAWDEQLNRPVAIKVTFQQFLTSGGKTSYLAEAQTVASLDHPQIVPVFDVGQTASGDYYVVSKLVEGSDLAVRIAKQRPSRTESVNMVISIAEALQHAHSKGLVHRDVKPANILIDSLGRAFLTDFGIALCEVDFGKQQGAIGTPGYMSPEQARGEGHRVDGRSDLYSLGVVLYELLTGRRPFQSDDMLNLMQRIAESEVRPPRQLDHSIPRELERICLKALALRASDRYPTCSDFAEDLRYPATQESPLTPPQSAVVAAAAAEASHPVTPVAAHSPVTPTPAPTGPTRVVPQGLRSYDQSTVDFFLELLPGPVDRMGLPDNIRFWKSQLQTAEAEQSFSVGLIYGPSGCGKSSLVKAGLIPHLADSVIPVYLEATGEDTEQRLAGAIRKKLPALGNDAGLRDTLTAIRRGQGLAPGKSLLLVIDQFEQWLHAHDDYRNTELTAALRQCDGLQIRCIVMVRDDFWLSVSRFMRELEVDIEASNSRLIDLFDLDHAARVLGLFGRAFRKLPDSSSEWTKDQKDFVHQAVAGLAQDRKVVCVRLALFAEMMKSRDWTPAALKEVGGTEGVGTTFLEETFSSRTAPPQYRYHQAAARAVLATLLSDSTTCIKGNMRSQVELQEAAGYQHRPSDFRELLRILDSELRLITPTDLLPDPPGEPEASASGYVRSRAASSGLVRSGSVSSGLNTPRSVGDNSPADAGGSPRDHSPGNHSPRYYQLTHDYLVPSLRDWLTRKQRETRKGRAELKLEERTALWTAKPENRYLPSLTEWIGIRWLTEKSKWTAVQKSVMQRASRVHGIRTALTAGMMCLLMIMGLGLTRQAELRKNQAEAARLVEGLLAADTTQVSTSISSLKNFRSWTEPQLKQAFDTSPIDSNAKLHAGLALVADRDSSESEAVDSSVLHFLRDRLLTVSPGQFASVRELLKPHKAHLIPAWWQLAVDKQQSLGRRFHAACALADLDPSHANWSDAEFTKVIADQLVAVSPVFLGEYQELLRPASDSLVPALSEIFQDPARSELAKTLATTLLADYAAADPGTLTELVLVADETSDKTLFPVLQQHEAAAVKNMEAVLAQRLQPDWKDVPLDPAWTEPSAAVRAQIEAAHGLISERYAFCPNMPLSQFLEIAETLRASGYRPTKVRPHAERVSSVVQNAVAAIWTRDGRKWELQPTVTKAQLPGPDAPAAKDGVLLTELAAIPSSDPASEPQFIALWCDTGNSSPLTSPPHNSSPRSLAPSGPSTPNAPLTTTTPIPQHRVLIDLTEGEFTVAQSRLTEQGFVSQSTISVRTDHTGQRRYTAIFSNQGAPSELRPAYAGFELVHQPQWDVAVAKTSGGFPDPLERFRKELTWIESLPAEENDDPKIRNSRASAHYTLGHLEEALSDLNILVARNGTSIALQGNEAIVAMKHRALTLARLGRADEARAALREYLKTDAVPHMKLSVPIQISAALGDFGEASSQLEVALLATKDDLEGFYIIVRAAALSSQFLSSKDATQSRRFADRTIELINLGLQRIAPDYSLVSGMKSEPDFASLHTDPRFLALLERLEPPATYAALSRADVEFESKLLTAAPASSIAEQLKPLLAEDWRPFAIALDPVGGARPGVAGLPTEPLCTVVLHRPLIPDSQKETLALQQAAAATALLRLNATDHVWPLFHDQPDPRLRSYLLHRLARYGVDPQSLFTQLQQETETSRQRSLILGLGEFARTKLLSLEQTTAITADVAKRYADDPDSGVHGAAEWALKQLGADNQIAEIRVAFSTGQVIGDRRWYLTKTGVAVGDAAAVVAGVPTAPCTTGMTFAVFYARDEFLMGSPISETERVGGPTDKSEIRHRRRIGRRFAIGMHEITVAQFRAFRKNHEVNRAKAREEDSPANRITWYDTAAYCNWLSEREGIPREQWCYDPEQAFKAGMSMPPDYLQRTGYRLLTEAEWEYACRAGTTTARYFGETDTLLGEYAWYTKNSGDQWMLPVGTLRPNGAGLNDMQGNVLEWCQDSAQYYETDADRMVDMVNLGRLDNSSYRVLRGGSFSGNASYVRSALRTNYLPELRYINFGFRVGRTLTPVPVSALLPVEAEKNLKSRMNIRSISGNPHRGTKNSRRVSDHYEDV